jgi:hypothetical protein
MPSLSKVMHGWPFQHDEWCLYRNLALVVVLSMVHLY